jgi:hypothetical protein
MRAVYGPGPTAWRSGAGVKRSGELRLLRSSASIRWRKATSIS